MGLIHALDQTTNHTGVFFVQLKEALLSFWVSLFQPLIWFVLGSHRVEKLTEALRLMRRLGWC